MNKVIFTLRSIGLTFVGVIIAVVVTSAVHALFALFMDPFPMNELANAENWSAKYDIMQVYMQNNPLAVWSMLLGHALGAAAAVVFSVKTAKVPKWVEGPRIKPYTGSIVLVALWVWGDIQNDLQDVPVGMMWTVVDIATTVALSGLAFVLAGGLKKQLATKDVL